MQERDFYLYINGQPVQVSREVYREYYRAEDKERYFMGKLKHYKGICELLPISKMPISPQMELASHLLEEYLG